MRRIAIVLCITLLASPAYAEPTEEECKAAPSPAAYKAMGCLDRGKPKPEGQEAAPAKVEAKPKLDPDKTDHQIIEGLVLRVEKLERDLSYAEQKMMVMQRSAGSAGASATCSKRSPGGLAAATFVLAAAGGLVGGILSESPALVGAGIGSAILPAGLVGAGVSGCSKWLTGTGVGLATVAAIAWLAIGTTAGGR